MSDLPQPADRRQPPTRQLRVSDADREQAAEVLRQAAGDGRITFDELDQRLEAAYGARTYGDLTEVTADLPAPGEAPPGPPQTAPGTFPAARIGGEPGSGMSVAILGGVDRGGHLGGAAPAQRGRGPGRRPARSAGRAVQPA